MWFVYVLRSTRYPFIYIGHTNNIERRLREHNEGLNQSTKHYAPFIVEAYVAVSSEMKAVKLEKYFKTGSGKAVLKKRILAEACQTKP
jgi:putative endonuclease